MDAKKRKEAEAIGKRIFQLRTGRGLSQRQLAAGTSISAVYICRIEKGERLPSLQVIRELASKLGVSLEFLETGQERPLEELIEEIRRRLPGMKITIESEGEDLPA